ncbi:hypothetical protein C8R47DRAFT_1081461 [Mycena vitilis]|nr:hypothetical protein C8R47DRAFT_1081461 [Mycena vitilis]
MSLAGLAQLSLSTAHLPCCFVLHVLLVMSASRRRFLRLAFRAGRDGSQTLRSRACETGSISMWTASSAASASCPKSVAGSPKSGVVWLGPRGETRTGRGFSPALVVAAFDSSATLFVSFSDMFGVKSRMWRWVEGSPYLRVRDGNMWVTQSHTLLPLHEGVVSPPELASKRKPESFWRLQAAYNPSAVPPQLVQPIKRSHSESATRNSTAGAKGCNALATRDVRGWQRPL